MPKSTWVLSVSLDKLENVKHLCGVWVHADFLSATSSIGLREGIGGYRLISSSHKNLPCKIYRMSASCEAECVELLFKASVTSGKQGRLLLLQHAVIQEAQAQVPGLVGTL